MKTCGQNKKQYSPVRRKIRGWKKFPKIVDNWRKECAGWHSTFEGSQRLPEGELYFDTWAKLRLYPWGSYLKEMREPAWIRKLIVDALVDIFHHWRTLAEATGEPY